MPTYEFTGESEEIFPDFSAVLQPGDKLETQEPVEHPRLKLVGGNGSPKPPPPAPPEPTEEVS
jgi:hypothetical protein